MTIQTSTGNFITEFQYQQSPTVLSEKLITEIAKVKECIKPVLAKDLKVPN